MPHHQQTLLQERVKTLVLGHALEAVLGRLSVLMGEASADELKSLQRLILTAAQTIPDKAPREKLAVLSAVEDASDTVRAAFGKIQQRHNTGPSARLSLVA